MIYQAEDKALVAAYLAAEGVAGSRSHEITGEALDLPYPVWAAIRAAYFDLACAWRQGWYDSKAGGQWYNCPYESGSREAYAWLQGFRQERGEA